MYFSWGVLDTLGVMVTNSLGLPLKGRHVSFIGAVEHLTGKNTPMKVLSTYAHGSLDKVLSAHFSIFVTFPTKE
jgi:hypothetical protein